jgi:hypothetical protein
MKQNITQVSKVAFTSIAMSISFAASVFAQSVTPTLPVAPAHQSPAVGSTIVQNNLTKADWSDITVTNTPVSYVYESSGSSAIKTDGSFVSPLYISGSLQASEISIAGTPVGTYYWHVRSQDAAGNKSAWSTPTVFTVSPANNTSTSSTSTPPVVPDTFAPLAPREVSVKKSLVSGVSTQVWSWSPARDWNWNSTSSGINRYEYSISGSSTTAYTSLGNVRTLTTKLAPGTYTLSIRAIDNAGNVGKVATKTITVQAPFASGIAPTSEKDCKKGGWSLYTQPNFANEKACKQFVKGTKQESSKRNDKNHSENESEHGSSQHKNGRDD